MARKVFISVLGTSFYGKCSYFTHDNTCTKDDFHSKETRFIQKATLELIKAKEWTSDDEVLILLTEKARSSNWCVKDNRRINGFTKEEEQYIGLEDELNEMHLPMPIKTLDIPDGRNEEEIWNIFEKLYNDLQEGDELNFDLTHGFRYLPMLVLVLGNYAHQLKHTEIKSITYGNWEARINNHEAPFVDITPFATLQNWTIAVHDYLSHGDATLLKTCSEKPLKAINRKAYETNGKVDEDAKALQNLSKWVDTFSENIRFNRGNEIIIGKESSLIKEYSNIDCDYLRPLKPLLGKIKDSVADFEENSPKNMILAACLCIEYQNYPSAVSLLQEGVVSLLCEVYGIDILDKDQREIINKALRKKDRPDDYKPTNDSEKEKKIDEICQDESLNIHLVKAFAKLNEARNFVNHAGMKKKKYEAKAIRKHVKEAADEILDCFSTLNPTVELSSPTPRPRLLINLSNHEFSKWSDEQQEATKEYGVCEDMNFPAISPDMDSEEIKQLADRYIKEIVEKNKEYQVTVHLMGEMAFTHYAVSQLLRLGIPCICSTTARIVIEEADGTKTAQFRFARFRHYTD